MPERIEVLVRGKLLSDWQSVEISRAVDAASGSFEITSPARNPYPLAPGDEVEIYCTDELVLRGHVDVVERSLSGSQRSVRFSGRDRTADLVDCSARNEPGEWTNILLPDLVRAIASPFNVGVDATAGPRAPFETFHLRPGDSAWNAIERACRLRGVLVYGDGTGRLVIREAGRDLSDAELIEGENLLTATFTADDSERFRTYLVLGQRPGSDLVFGDQAALVEGSAEDAGARASRSLVIVAEASVTNQTAQERAQWEATVRAARAVRVDAAAPGWRQAPLGRPGRLWTINEQVPVRAPSIDLDRYLLVRSLRLRQTAGLEQAEMQLVRPDAYQPQPVLPEAEDPLAEYLRATAEGESLPDDPDPDLDQ